MPTPNEGTEILEGYSGEEFEQNDVTEIPADAATSADHANPRRRRRDREQQEAPVGFVVEPDPLRDTFERLVMHE